MSGTIAERVAAAQRRQAKRIAQGMTPKPPVTICGCVVPKSLLKPMAHVIVCHHCWLPVDVEKRIA